MPTFVVIIESKKVVSHGTVVTNDKQQYWIARNEYMWDSGLSLSVFPEPPLEVKTWGTKEEAEQFARSWEGHPWWVKPNGSFKILEVTPKMVQRGWTVESVTQS
jgi:hypothetical protein